LSREVDFLDVVVAMTFSLHVTYHGFPVSSNQWADCHYYQQISPDGRKAAISAFQSPTADLWLVDMERGVPSRVTSLMAGRPEKIFDVPVGTSIGSMHAVHFVVSADGQRFLLGVSVINQTSTTVVLNWAQGLNLSREF
jgi:hypothetical protein